jgi:acetyl-CoA acetyltransferase
MKFRQAAFPLSWVWSSPFVRWQGSLADVSSIDVAAAVTANAMAARSIDTQPIDHLMPGQTIPQRSSYYAGPCLAAAAQAQAGGNRSTLIVTTDRTSNGRKRGARWRVQPRGT